MGIRALVFLHNLEKFTLVKESGAIEKMLIPLSPWKCGAWCGEVE
jgi:hypothetical protein